MAILAIISIILVILDYSHVINLYHGPWMWLDNMILIIFTIDYFVRFFKAPNRKDFFKNNIFDLLSIIPVSGMFYLFRGFRIARLIRVTRLLRLFRLVGLAGKLRKFLHTNGFIYWLYLSITLLVICAVAYSISENVSLGEAFWWAIATSTTVGYGDISPHTFVGKIVAFVLMLVGIGIIGMLTSSITAYFERNYKENTDKVEKLDIILKELEEIKIQNHQLKKEIDNLKSSKSDHNYNYVK